MSWNKINNTLNPRWEVNGSLTCPAAFGRSILLPPPSTVQLHAAAFNNKSFTSDVFLLLRSAVEQLMLTFKLLSFCIFISTCFDKQDQFTPHTCVSLSAALCRYHCKPNPVIVVVPGIQTGEFGIGTAKTVQ